MSDLPRYHEGGIGPIDFAKVNDMMQRLDRVLPLLENPALRQQTFSKPRLNPFLVKTEEKIGNKFAWVELTLSENGLPIPDAAPDNEGISGRAGNEDEESTLAACIDPDWAGGTAICYALNDVEGTPRYILVPSVEGEAGPPTDHPIELVYVMNPYSDSLISVDDDGDGVFNLNLEAFRYECRVLKSAPGFSDTDLSMNEQVETLYDFGYQNMDPGLLNGNPVPFQYSVMPYGSIRLAIRMGAGNFANELCIAYPPRLDYSCP